MNINDYLLVQEDIDWANTLGAWHWLLPEELTVWFANLFGDVFVILEDGSVSMLDIGAGSFERLADSRDQFCELLETPENANIWLMIPLVDSLIASGKSLKRGTCYSFVRSPVLGGDYSVENSMIIPIAEHYGLNAELHHQIKDLPDGTAVRINFTDDESRRSED